MSAVPRMRYRVRNAAGEELVVPSLGALHDLYVHGFLSDDDLVRAETGTHWTRAGAFAPLQGARASRQERDPRKIALLVAAALALAIGVGLLARLLR